MNDFLEKHFKHMRLEPGLFYEWPIGLRFELGLGAKKEQYYSGSPYLKGAYRRALTLFEETHPLDEEMWIVMDIHRYSGRVKTRNARMWKTLVKDHKLLYRLKHTELPYYIPEDDESGNWRTHRWMLPCKPSDIHYRQLLTLLVEQDMGFSKANFQSLYFVHPKNETIFHVYDDRGCDLVAASRETIRPHYESFNEWVLDYDREAIDEVFN